MADTKASQLDYDAIARQTYDWLKSRRSRMEISTAEAVKKATRLALADKGDNVLTVDDCFELHDRLMTLIDQEKEYWADFSAYDNQYVGLPCFIPFVFRKK